MINERDYFIPVMCRDDKTIVMPVGINIDNSDEDVIIPASTKDQKIIGVRVSTTANIPSFPTVTNDDKVQLVSPVSMKFVNPSIVANFYENLTTGYTKWNYPDDPSWVPGDSDTVFYKDYTGLGGNKTKQSLYINIIDNDRRYLLILLDIITSRGDANLTVTLYENEFPYHMNFEPTSFGSNYTQIKSDFYKAHITKRHHIFRVDTDLYSKRTRAIKLSLESAYSFYNYYVLRLINIKQGVL